MALFSFRFHQMATLIISRRAARGGAWQSTALIMITAGAILLQMAGLDSRTPPVMAATSVLLLLAGLPHGSFDLALLRQSTRQGCGVGPVLLLVLLYLGCAAAMYLVWQMAPGLALAAFLLMAIGHFAEDWVACGSRFLAAGLAAAIVAAPAIAHSGDLRGLFITLTDDAGAAVLADLLLMVAPAMLLVALVAIRLLWAAGRADLAVAATCSLCAMLVLPPVAGFALFFALVHSPLQFRAHAGALGLHGFRQWRSVVWPISLGGLAVAGAIYAMRAGMTLPDRAFAVSFITLSVLTAPHMLVPWLQRLIARRAAPQVPGAERG